MPVANGWLGSDLIGKTVRNASGETLGKLEELLIDPATGHVELGILSFGGLLGMGDRLVPVPWQSLGIIPGRDYILLDTDKNVLDQAPSFDRRQCPDPSDIAWRARVYSHFGYSVPPVRRERTVVVRKEYRPPQKKMSVMAASFVILVVLAALGFTYMVATRGWEQAKADTIRSLQGVTYAMKETSADAALTAKVKTTLSLNKRLEGTRIGVESSGGTVTLRGEVSDGQTRSLAGTVAEDTPGVREVHNYLYVVSPDR